MYVMNKFFQPQSYYASKDILPQKLYMLHESNPY